MPASGTSNWTFTAPTLIDGRYALRASARDGAGNIGTSSAIDFFIDNLAPLVSISTPRVDYAYRRLAQARGVQQMELGLPAYIRFSFNCYSSRATDIGMEAPGVQPPPANFLRKVYRVGLLIYRQ